MRGDPGFESLPPHERLRRQLARGESFLKNGFIDRTGLLVIGQIIPVAHGLGDRQV